MSSLNRLPVAGSMHQSSPESAILKFEDYLKCGRLEYGFLRVRCTECHQERLLFNCGWDFNRGERA